MSGTLRPFVARGVGGSPAVSLVMAILLVVSVAGLIFVLSEVKPRICACSHTEDRLESVWYGEVGTLELKQVEVCDRWKEVP